MTAGQTRALVYAIGGVPSAAAIAVHGSPWVMFPLFVGGMLSAAAIDQYVLASPNRPGVDACSFCKKPRAQVKFLVAGDRVAICDACVQLCTDILTPKPGAPPSMTNPFEPPA